MTPIGGGGFVEAGRSEVSPMGKVGNGARLECLKSIIIVAFLVVREQRLELVQCEVLIDLVVKHRIGTQTEVSCGETAGRHVEMRRDRLVGAVRKHRKHRNDRDDICHG